MSNYTNPLTQMALASNTTTAARQQQHASGGTWFEAMARAWGEALDNQAEHHSAGIRSAQQPAAPTCPRRSPS